MNRGTKNIFRYFSEMIISVKSCLIILFYFNVYQNQEIKQFLLYVLLVICTASKKNKQKYEQDQRFPQVFHDYYLLYNLWKWKLDQNQKSYNLTIGIFCNIICPDYHKLKFKILLLKWHYRLPSWYVEKLEQQNCWQYLLRERYHACKQDFFS